MSLRSEPHLSRSIPHVLSIAKDITLSGPKARTEHHFMTKAELIETLKDVPDSYKIVVGVSNGSGDYVETDKGLTVRVVNTTQEIMIEN